MTFALPLLLPAAFLAQSTLLRGGTNSSASAESVLFSIAKDAADY
jgi:hypothetical protein